MNNMQPTISESLLRTDLNALAQELIRELALAAKKVRIYGPQHPTATKALARPLVFLSQYFHFRQCAQVVLFKGNLHVFNIRLSDTAFAQQIIEYMQTLDLTSILITDQVAFEELGQFINRLVKRVPPASPEYRMTDFLQRNRIGTIEVNSERSAELFERQKQYRGDVHGDFSVKRLALDQMGEDLYRLTGFKRLSPEQLLAEGIDFHAHVIAYLVPEKVTHMSAEPTRDQLTDWAARLRDDPDSLPPDSLDRFMGVIKLLENHPDRELIMADIVDGVAGDGSQASRSELVGETGRIRLQTREHIKELMSTVFSADADGWDDNGFPDAFERLVRTGQHDQAIDTLAYLLDRLTDTNPGFRQRALNLATIAVDRLDHVAHGAIMEALLEMILIRLAEKEETFEYSELMSAVFSKCFEQGRFDLTARLAEGMAARRTVSNGVTVYDTMAVKKACENISQSTALHGLIRHMLKATHEELEMIRRTLVAVGTEEVALGLSEIIAHPLRQVRQHCLRILAELGKATLTVFADILLDDLRFERPDDRRELPDPKWYVVRNSIYVLGSVKDPAGLVPLRLRMNDTDSRVRREIISALEKIGGEDAVDLLTVMAEDSDREIAQAAVITIGLIAGSDSAPLMVDLANRNPHLVLKAVHALGRLGGVEARTWLTALLADESALQEIAGGRVPKDELRIAVIKALAMIGDNESRKALQSFQETLSGAQRVFSKNSPVQKALSEALS